MGGPDTIKGISYQNAYSVYRLMDLVDLEKQATAVSIEGKGEDVEDLTVTYSDGSEEAIQIKKRDTREGAYGHWGLSDIKPIAAALFRLVDTDRKIILFRFVATGSAHARVIGIQKACQRLRDKSFSMQKDERAVSDVRDLTGGDDVSVLDFMRQLYIDVPLESEEFFALAVQNRLMKDFGVPKDVVERMYNDLYKRVLDHGKEGAPGERMIDRETLLGWIEHPRDQELGEDTRITIRQRAKELRGKMIGVDVEAWAGGSAEVEQEAENVSAEGEMTGFKAQRVSGGEINVHQDIDEADESGPVTGAKIDKL